MYSEAVRMSLPAVCDATSEQRGPLWASLPGAKRQRRLAVHSFHRYFGKLIPAIPRQAVALYTSPGDWVADPFCGSGTTLVEAVAAGRRALGLDINPLAVLISRAKTTGYPVTLLRRQAAALEESLGACNGGISVPAAALGIPNEAHWFQPQAGADLAALLGVLRRWPDPDARLFFLACVSAIIRRVSNADPRHIFPGYSKRLRALDRAGLRPIQVQAAFRQAVQKRLSALEELQRLPGFSRFRVEVKTAAATTLPQVAPAEGVRLIVTNPPYLGSIRYLETMKLEMFCLGLVQTPQALADLDRQGLGSERIYAAEYKQFEPCGLEQVDALASRLFAAGHRKMARVTQRYFLSMREFLQAAASSLQPGGHLVVKISDSYVRGLRIPTHGILLDLAAPLGLHPVEVFRDAIQSHSLTTRRNSYSRLLPWDWLVVWERRGGPSVSEKPSG
ncbi:MAG: hypothetical protein IMW99_06000 [Firmicutes bacterium]|nr:hypothetical protein [Bacillota bacterium]